jgi:hypothetical protein
LIDANIAADWIINFMEIKDNKLDGHNSAFTDSGKFYRCGEQIPW